MRFYQEIFPIVVVILILFPVVGFILFAGLSNSFHVRCVNVGYTEAALSDVFKGLSMMAQFMKKI